MRSLDTHPSFCPGGSSLAYRRLRCLQLAFQEATTSASERAFKKSLKAWDNMR
jgi:hypothetical protein